MIAAADRAADLLSGEISGRFGLVPNFFRSGPAAPELIERLWAFARSAYLDSPLPPLFKERLLVHLSRFCAARYCIVRHVGFLIGQGYPAGDPDASPQSLEQALALLRRPVPGAAALDSALGRLEDRPGPVAIPTPETELEADLFAALAVVFLRPVASTRALKAVRRTVGTAAAEFLVGLLDYVRAAHYWTETHPEIEFEPDMVVVMQRHKELSRLLLDTTDVPGGDAAARLQDARAELHEARTAMREAERRLGRLAEQQRLTVVELQHRTRNLLTVIQGIADETIRDSDSLDSFARRFGDSLDALARAHSLLVQDGEAPITLNALVRGQLAALSGSRTRQRVVVDGPEIPLPAAIVQMLALAIHELGAHARRHGALAGESGRLSVTWRLRGSGPDRRRVVLEWLEEGFAPPPRAALADGSYARRLVEQALPYALDASTTYEASDSALRCTIDMPLAG